MIALSVESFAPAPMGVAYPMLIKKTRIRKDKEDIETPQVQREDVLSKNTWR